MFVTGFLLAFCFWLIIYLLRYCRNPYTLRAVVGSKGSGKSLLLAKVANEWHRKSKGEIYSNMDIGYPLSDSYWLDEYPPDSLILIDEIAVLHSNRQFKSFPPEAVEWYKMSRKRKLTIVVSSQTMDFDKKIRDLCDRIIVCRKIGFVCVCKSYKSCISMVTTQDGGHDLVNDIKRVGGFKLYTVPKNAKLASTLGYRTEQIISKSNLTQQKNSILLRSSDSDAAFTGPQESSLPEAPGFFD